MSGPYFFGCWREPGHYLFNASGRTVNEREAGLPWRDLDAALCPGRRGRFGVVDEDQVEGHAALHHLGGWTALAFWDRSVDRRVGCNAAFLVEGLLSADVVLRVARERFPSVMARFSFPIVVVSRPSELVNGSAVCSACGRGGTTAELPGGWKADPPGWMRRGGELACSPGCARAIPDGELLALDERKELRRGLDLYRALNEARGWGEGSERTRHALIEVQAWEREHGVRWGTRGCASPGGRNG